MALTLRIPDVKEDLRRDPRDSSSLVDVFSEVRDDRVACDRLGVSQHPALITARRLKYRPKRIDGILSRIFYRHDVEAKYASRSVERTRHEREAVRRAYVGTKQVKTSKDTPVTHDGVVRAALLDHFRSVADPSRFYALQMAPTSAVEGVLNEPLAKRQKRPTRKLVCDVDLADDDVDDDDGGLRGVSGDDAIGDVLANVPLLYFRVVHAHPSVMHTVRVPLAAGRRLSADHIAITTNKTMNQGLYETEQVIASKPFCVKGSSVVAMDGFETVDIDTVIDSFVPTKRARE